ncbi:MAG: 4Fe-4S binding protein [Candidatus Omnitrophota bacterium]
MKKLIFFRRLSQVSFLSLFIYILWSTTYPLKGLLPADTFFKINPLIIFFTSISERIMLPGALFAGMMLILTLILGRFFCGWICPLGSMIDACGSVGRKKRNMADKTNKIPSSLKFYILGITAIFSFLGIQVAWIFDPMVITARFVSLNLIPSLTFGIDSFFIFIIKGLNFYSPIYDFYRGLKTSFLGVDARYFPNSGIILLFFLVVCFSTLLTRRLWCRWICPLGALYSLVARFSLLRRVVHKCVNCMRCKSDCRMAAIKDDLSYIKGECILCMDCIYDCQTRDTRFTWPVGLTPDKKGEGISRRQFLFLLVTSILSLGFKSRRRLRIEETAGSVIRPPAALKEKEFLNRCVRCGNCMKVCITNGLQPVMFESGIQGIWTPRLVPEVGYCEYQCTLCGNVCPTGAIPRLSLSEKKKTRLGLAEIDRSICIAWTEDKECIVCEEHCPVAQKAIKLTEYKMGERTVLKPSVDNRLCIGCGICQYKCPVRPVRAIRVSPGYSDRT